MTGKHILDLMTQEGYSISRMAQMIGTSQPNLSSALKHTDIRTGLLEDIAKKDIPRVRFMTSHPWDFTDSMIEVIGKYPNISSISAEASANSFVIICTPYFFKFL